MSGTNAFDQANYLCHRQACQQRHRWQQKQQILRSQVGFNNTPASRPTACAGCANYHGLSYGTRSGRTPLVCAMHPYGWRAAGRCPDWRQG